jgi:putative SOS response-associated peptidase YedK
MHSLLRGRMFLVWLIKHPKSSGSFIGLWYRAGALLILLIKHMLGNRHCVIAIDGFYEWEQTKEKRPFHFSMADGDLMLLAGLWDYNTKLDTPVLSCTVITREPNQIIGEVHNRMPVILTRSQMDIWLNTTLSYAERAEVLQPIENSALLKVEIGKSINKAANKSGDWFKGPDEKPICLF